MFSSITEEMLSVLNPVDLQRYEYIKTEIEQGKLTPPLVVRRFSDLAFSLARQSLKSGAPLEIATPLGKIFDDYLNSHLISIDTKAKMKPLIGETQLDFLYASGDHHLSSLRLAPYLISQNA